MRLRLWLSLLLLWLPLATLAAERLLLERRSDYNGAILVSEDRGGFRILRFEPGGARQSVVKLGDPDHLELPYARAIPVAFVFVDQPSAALVIGLGGGTIPSFLHKRFPALVIDAVDIDPGVVEVAQSHFGFREDARMRAHIEDGRRFVERSARRYDVVFLDGFGTDSVPPHLATREFLDAVRRILTPGGVVIGNVWGRFANRHYDSMIRTYRDVYEHVAILDVPSSGNKLVIASSRDPGLSGWQLVARAREVSQRLQLRHDLAEIVEHGLRPPGEDGATGVVLTDAAAGFGAGK